MVVLSLAMIACESPSKPEVDAPLPNFSKGALRSSATGSGQFKTAESGLRSFGFSALELGNVVSGAFAGHNQTSDRSVQGIVTCFIIDGNQAWIGGTIEQFTPGPGPNVTADAGFRVADLGRAGRPNPDAEPVNDNGTLYGIN